MSEDVVVEGEHHEHGRSKVAGLFSPQVCAVTAFTLAVAALLGQNVVSLATSTVLEFGLDMGSDGAFYFGWGLATAVQAAVVVLLARRTFDLTDGWEAILGRAAILVAGLALVAAAIVVVAGLVHQVQGF
jgi:hypothetical protein